MTAEQADGRCVLTIDGDPVTALEGQSLIAVLIASGHWAVRRHPVSGAPRGPLCGMGVCFECELEVDGVQDVRACLTSARDHMQIRTAVRSERRQP